MYCSTSKRLPAAGRRSVFMTLLCLIGVFSVTLGVANGQAIDPPLTPPTFAPPEVDGDANPYGVPEAATDATTEPADLEDTAVDTPLDTPAEPADTPETPAGNPDEPIEPALPDSPFEPALPDSPDTSEAPEETAAADDQATAPEALPELKADQAVITTYVPEDARVYINGMLTDLTGTTRRFYSQGLKPDLQYPYKLVIEWTENGRLHRAQQSVLMQVGDHKSVRVGKQPRPETPAVMSHDEYPTTEISIELPEDAKLFIDGVPSPGTGAKRRFATEELAPDAQPVEYVLRVEWIVGGRTLTDSRKITVRGGEKKLVRFDFEEQVSQIAAIKDRGQDLAAVNAIKQAAVWIVGRQLADGGWALPPYSTEDGSCLPGTAIAIMPLVLAGQTSDEGLYHRQVAQGVYYLIERQAADGGFREAIDRPIDPFSQAIATIAMCETLAARQDERLRPAAQKAVDLIVKNQDEDGSWTYDSDQPANLSTFGWQVMALSAAERVGIEIDPQVKARAAKFLETLAVNGGQEFSYTAGRKPTPAMSAEGLLAALLLGSSVEQPTIAEGIMKLIADNPPETSAVDIYYWFYTTLLTRQAGGEAWSTWWPQVRDSLLQMRLTQGDAAGSWAPTGMHMEGGSPLMMTTLATMILESRFREK